MKQRGFRYCPTCNNKLQKRGLTAAGTQRWKCLSCNKSLSLSRVDLSRGLFMDKFAGYLLGKNSQSELGISSRTFREKAIWCWNINPRESVSISGEVYGCIIIDGIRVGSEVCLIASTTNFIIYWLWVPYESSYYWQRLLSLIPPPVYVVCDGQKGILKAIKQIWPNTLVQRCRVHLWFNVKNKLTLKPEHPSSQQLLWLTKELLCRVKNRRQARNWKKNLGRWHKKYRSYLDQRTLDLNPLPGKRKWSYTHPRLRSAYKQLHTTKEDLLRSSYRYKPIVPSTTNHLEGGINSQLRRLLKQHRGMINGHQKRLVDWYLFSRVEDRKPPRFCL